MKTVAEIEEAYRLGRSLFRSFNKNCNVVTVAGVGQDLSGQTGNPPAQFYVGSIATFTPLARSTDGGLDHGPVMTGAKKFLHKLSNLQAISSLVPCTLELHDYLGFYPFIGMDTGIQDLFNTVPVPRYAAREGIQMMLIEQNSYVGAAQVRINYTNQDGVPGRVTPIITLNSVTNAGTVATSGPNLVGGSGQYIALQDSDYGVQAATSIEVITGDVGVLCLVLVKPLATVGVFDINTPADWDMWESFGFLPEIRNDAYLNLLLKPPGNATGTTLWGNLITLWRPE